MSFGASWIQPSDLALVALSLALGAAFVRRRVRPSGWGIAAAGVAYLLALALSIALASDPADLAWLRLVAYAPFVLLPWTLPHAIEAEDGARLVVRAWLLAAGVSIALGLIQVAGFYAARRWFADAFPCSYGRIPEGPYPRICGPFRNPNAFVDYLAATAPLAILFARDLVPRRWLIPAAGAFGVASLFTLSSGIGGIAVAAAIAGGAVVPARRRVLLAGGLLVAAGFLLASVGYRVPAGFGHVSVPGGEWHVLKGPRVHTWLSAVATIRDHPVTGVGYGSLVAHAPRLRRWYRQGYAEALHVDRPPTKDAHQTWLSVAGQAGLVGLAAFVGLLVACVRGLSAAGRRGPPRGIAPRLAVAVFAGLVGTVGYHGLFASVEEFRHVWALVALGVVSLRLRGGARA